MLRVVRLVRSFRELRMVLNSILGSMQSMLWPVILIAGIMFVFGMCFVQGTITYLVENPDRVNSDVGHSMNTLWMATTGGVDWIILADGLWAMGEVYYFLFLLFMDL